jgi:hypothetical protein
MRSFLRILGVVLVMAAMAAVATELPSPRLGPALLLRLDGVLTADHAVAEKVGFTVASFAFLGHGKDADRLIGVTEARTVGGDVPADGVDVLDAVAPFKPNFLASGAPALVKDLLALPDGTAIRIEGLVDRGSRTFLIRSFERREPEKP